MQILPTSDDTPAADSGARVGDLVRIRGQRWRVLDVRAYEDCRLVAVVGIGAANDSVERRFLQPFDAVGNVERPSALRFVSPRRWRGACRALLAAAGEAVGLRSARHARLDLLPYQLEPALAILRGLGSRALLADDVGLGKTIQAALVVAELRERGLAERVLVLTPAGLRDQWSLELNDRFGIAADVIDNAAICHRVASLPVGLNPWATTTAAIASLDYVKRTDVLHSVMSSRWDILIIDEAHGAANDSDRRAAVAALASRTPYVLLLTATPHSGDPSAFDALCRTGSHGDPVLVFRRSRPDVRPGAGRRVHHLHVHPTATETRMHSLLAEFTSAVRAEHAFEEVWLPLSVLHKRAHSSAKSLERSLRRLTGPGLIPDWPSRGFQMPLPLESDGMDTSDEPPGLSDSIRLTNRALEESLHQAMIEAAAAAARSESKIRALLRLLRRIQEPVIVFTEYRDTLLHLRDHLKETASILHGGLSRSERSAALAGFVQGECRILLATDTAGEGLNLQPRCRCVVNLELPWNPMRLEQRIGRVDRIGQTRTVHVFHLVAGGTGEAHILERLQARILRASRDIAVPDPVGANERRAAQVLFGGSDAHVVPPQETASHPGRVTSDLSRESLAEASRLSAIRSFVQPQDQTVASVLESTGTWITRARHSATRVRLGSRLLAIFRVETEDGQGRTVDAVLVSFGLSISTAGRPHCSDRTALRSLTTLLREAAHAAAQQQRSECPAFWRAFVDTRVERERRIVEAMADSRRLQQPGLFDKRAQRQQAAARATMDLALREFTDRMARWYRAGQVTSRPARLMLVLIP